MLQRPASKAEGEGADLRLTVESAYIAEKGSLLGKRAKEIRFHVLATKIFQKKTVWFAPR